MLRLAWYIRPIRFENSIRNRIKRPIRFEIWFERKKTIRRSLAVILALFYQAFPKVPFWVHYSSWLTLTTSFSAMTQRYIYLRMSAFYTEQWCNWGGQRGAVAPRRSRQGGAKEPDQKYFMTNNHKSEFDIVFWMSMRHAMPSLAITLVLSILMSRLYVWLTRYTLCQFKSCHLL